MRKTVLIVDDDHDQRAILAGALEFAGYRTQEAENGHHAIQVASMMSPDVVLMDLQMPFVDGLTATEILKSKRDLNHIPIIGMTAFDYPPDQVRQVGFSDFLLKPIAPRDLIACIERALGGPQAGGMMLLV